ncbi:beta-1,3-galactosyltransferase 5-like [Gigantopelta aegis]|uniref:beta-1,3-galactosyltransferase 5-like n=1 Tax=Gigantopelta aegis TaxID=1735272 RepID=UPI001B888DC7|nr:beta-1,3-galactosyltransferase 5-like [Gigantopelta aegis]
MSLHHMTPQRQAIRDKWGSIFELEPLPGSSEYFPIEVFFVLGVSKNKTLNAAVAMEAEVKKDIIVAEFDDSYFNLTRKVLMAFKWVKEFCPTAKYVMKVDEDTYLNIPKFVALIQSLEWNNTLFGPYFFVDPVLRTGKYAISKTAFPAPKFPPHIKGNAYFMPIDVAMKILIVSEHMPYVSMEDVAITGVLAKIFNFRHFGSAKDQYYIHKAASTCELVTGSIIISQQIFVDTFYKIWDRVKNNSMCKTVK